MLQWSPTFQNRQIVYNKNDLALLLSHTECIFEILLLCQILETSVNSQKFFSLQQIVALYVL